MEVPVRVRTRQPVSTMLPAYQVVKSYPCRATAICNERPTPDNCTSQWLLHTGRDEGIRILPTGK